MDTKTILINPPAIRAGAEVTEIILRKPNAGNLRGLKVLNLMQGDAAELIELLPRISDPTLTKQEVSTMDAPSIANASIAVVGFFLQEEDTQSG